MKFLDGLSCKSSIEKKIGRMGTCNGNSLQVQKVKIRKNRKESTTTNPKKDEKIDLLTTQVLSKQLW
jgi:hypothetical protein